MTKLQLIFSLFLVMILVSYAYPFQRREVLESSLKPWPNLYEVFYISFLLAFFTYGIWVIERLSETLKEGIELTNETVDILEEHFSKISVFYDNIISKSKEVLKQLVQLQQKGVSLTPLQQQRLRYLQLLQNKNLQVNLLVSQFRQQLRLAQARMQQVISLNSIADLNSRSRARLHCQIKLIRRRLADAVQKLLKELDTIKNLVDISNRLS